jgi:hypothetical protein
MHTRSLTLTAVLFLACAAPKPAGNPAATGAAAALSDADRDAAVKYMEETRGAFLTAISGLSDAQYRFKPAPDRWSVAEVAEHIAVSETTLFAMVNEKMLKEPAPPALLSQINRDDARLRTQVTNRTSKVQAPEMLQPSGRFASPDVVKQTFNQSRDKTIEFVKTTPLNLRSYAGPHPVLGPLDGYQWMILVSAHTARHTAQIQEVKADPRFPR